MVRLHDCQQYAVTLRHIEETHCWLSLPFEDDPEHSALTAETGLPRWSEVCDEALLDDYEQPHSAWSRPASAHMQLIWMVARRLSTIVVKKYKLFSAKSQVSA